MLRAGIADDSVRVAHQAIIEFVAAVSRPIDAELPLLESADARRAEVFGLTELVTEDFQAERLYGSVRIVNPFS